MVKRLLALPLLIVVAVAGLPLLSVPAHADPVVTSSVTMFGTGDYIAGNNSWAWRSGDATITVSGSVTGTVAVHVSGGTLAPGADYFDLDFAAPRGQTLVAGVYEDAERASFRTEGHPGIDVSGTGRGCNKVAGRFEVLDIAPDLSRLHLVYESRCEGGDKPAFGEVRYNMPDVDADLLTVPGRVDWPDHVVTSAARTVPIRLVNTGDAPVTVTGASIAGSNAFKVVSNNCTQVAVGGRCTVGVAFAAPSVADFTATLTITDSTDAGSHTVALSGSGARADSTYATMVSSRRESSGASSWLWRGGDGHVIVSGYVQDRVTVQVYGGGLASDQYATLRFAAAPGETLTTGTYEDAEWAPFRSEGHPGIDVSSTSSYCDISGGRFTVLDIAPDLSRLHVIYEAQCGSSHSLFGEVRFQVPGDDADLLVAPSRIAWPDQGANTTAATVPVTVLNTGTAPMTVSAASVTAGDDVFKVVSNGCTKLAVAASCRIGVSFRPTTADDFTGALTLTDSTAAGTHVVALAGTGTPLPPNVALSTPKRLHSYGETIALTATLTGSYDSKTVSFYRRVAGGSRVLLGTREVNANGTATLSTTARENATYSVDWAEADATDTASVNVSVRARVGLVLSRHKRKSGAYHLYSPGARIVMAGAVLPARANRCAYFKAQVKVGTSWRLYGTTDCIRTNAAGKAAVYLGYSRDVLGRPLRFNVRFASDSRNVGATSAWKYAKYVR